MRMIEEITERGKRMFEGFEPQAIDFLWGIRMNNNREWFEQHKKEYVNYLYEPMKELGKELFEPFQEKPGTMLKVSRIYKDARMHPEYPYKESMWLSIRRQAEDWTQEPTLFFEISPEGVAYGFGLWQPKPKTMEAFRREWARDPEPFLSLMEQTQKKTGIPIKATRTYKRPKEAPIPELAPYFAWRGDILCVQAEPIGEEIFGRPLKERVAGFFEDLLPVYSYFSDFPKDI